MGKKNGERRKTRRHDLRTRVRLYNDETGRFENAHLENINYSGLYIMTRRKLNINDTVRISVPSEPDESPIKIKAKVIRLGNHRAWGLFSYACQILH